MTKSVIQQHVDEALREYRLNRTGTPQAFIRQYRAFSKIPGLSKGNALALAQKSFPKEYAAYVRAQNAGDELPPLDGHRTNYEQRLRSAVATGGIIR